MRKVEFAIQVVLATAIIFGLLGLGGIMATSAQAASSLGNLDPAVTTPPTRDDSQDRPAKKDPQIENHGTSLPKQATHVILNKDGSLDLT